jgi:predicted HicB family RNase H-like nuclease
MTATNVMTYRGYAARVEFDAADEIFIGHLAGINDVIAFHSDSASGLKTAFHDAVDDYVATCGTIGKTPEKPYSGKMMLRVDPEVHARVVLAAQLSGKSMNQWGEEVLLAAARAATAE